MGDQVYLVSDDAKQFILASCVNRLRRRENLCNANSGDEIQHGKRGTFCFGVLAILVLVLVCHIVDILQDQHQHGFH